MPAQLDKRRAAVPSLTEVDGTTRSRRLDPAMALIWLALPITTLVGVLLSRGTTASQLVATWGAAAIFVATSAWVFASARFDFLGVRHAVFVLLTLRLIAAFGQPLLEDDHYRYLWDGYVTATSGTPYAHAPEHFFGDVNVPSAMQAVLNGINHPDIPTVYGQLLQGVFAACYKIAPASLIPLKAILLMADLAVLGLLASAKAPGRCLLIYAIHPVLMKESAFTAHPDILIGLMLLGAALAWQRKYLFWAGVLVASAVAAKVSVIVVLPLFLLNHRGRPSLAALAGTIAGLASWYGPFAALGSGSEIAGVSAFGQQWIFNPLGFRLLALLLSDQNARVAAALLFVTAWLAIALSWQKRLHDGAGVQDAAAQTPIPPVIACLSTLLLLSPVVNPWYWMWAIPLACLRWNWTVQFGSAACLLAYAHSAGSLDSGSSQSLYHVPFWAALIQLAAIGIAMYADARGVRRQGCMQ